ncbi:hypothetical protein F5H01DRAFT_368348 [Linnemannia elongata]|nr:hypothetical protein F5H01DRAFT_368348 [Linnemannia elongata]
MLGELFGRLKDLKQLRDLEIEWYMCSSISEMTLENALELFCETESSIVPLHLIKAAARQYENKTQLPAGSHDIPDCSNEQPPWSTGDIYNARVGRQWKDWDDINQGCHPYAEADVSPEAAYFPLFSTTPASRTFSRFHIFPREHSPKISLDSWLDFFQMEEPCVICGQITLPKCAAQSLFPDATKAPGASQSAGLPDDDQCNEYHTLAPFFSLSLILENIIT